MKIATAKWLKFVKMDVEAAKILFKSGHKLGSAYIATIFHCHQAVEKMLKAIITEHDAMAPKTHDLVWLFKLTGLILPEDIIKYIKELDPHYLQPRYPDLQFQPSFTFTYNKRNTEQLFDKAIAILICLKENLTTKK